MRTMTRWNFDFKTSVVYPFALSLPDPLTANSRTVFEILIMNPETWPLGTRNAFDPNISLCRQLSRAQI